MWPVYNKAQDFYQDLSRQIFIRHFGFQEGLILIKAKVDILENRLLNTSMGPDPY